MSAAQNKFYWQLWSKLRKSKPGVDRHAEHLALGLPESHTQWHPKHDFDRWKDHCLGEADAKLPEDGEAKRKLVFIGHLLSALEKGEAYLDHTVATMNRGGKFGGRFRSADTLTGSQLKGVMIALKKECRRRWGTKDELLGEVMAVMAHCTPTDSRIEVMKALNTEVTPTLGKLVYEELLVALSAMRHLAAGTVSIFPASNEAAKTDREIDLPF